MSCISVHAILAHGSTVDHRQHVDRTTRVPRPLTRGAAGEGNSSSRYSDVASRSNDCFGVTMQLLQACGSLSNGRDSDMERCSSRGNLSAVVAYVAVECRQDECESLILKS